MTKIGIFLQSRTIWEGCEFWYILKLDRKTNALTGHQVRGIAFLGFYRKPGCLSPEKKAPEWSPSKEAAVYTVENIDNFVNGGLESLAAEFDGEEVALTADDLLDSGIGNSRINGIAAKISDITDDLLSDLAR